MKVLIWSAAVLKILIELRMDFNDANWIDQNDQLKQEFTRQNTAGLGVNVNNAF